MLPCTRWDNIFEQLMGTCWRGSAAPRAVWITLKDNFVSFAIGWATSSSKQAKQVLQRCYRKNAPATPRVIPDDMSSVLWFPLDGAARQLELNDDSKIVCNWLNGT